ncbi:hypothetical protein BHF71_07410 [Vulcanibacillus modesticaldus]|uniref:M23ase beta-sheet core domain-containing protein n=1 Tax=Vulcanibacillus modesticaldus TaxID=337097 RepID=A0A1D2YW97_9BACI|nr:M23 family metallopeptidase [Vulcanibacillus modesticaldus]OEF99927.1 hypothetical protein BHF71_07410 [Vulcanibacillus modesticaldus]
MKTKVLSIILLLVALIFGTAYVISREYNTYDREIVDSEEIVDNSQVNDQEQVVDEPKRYNIPIHNINGEPMFSIQDLSKFYDLRWEYDSFEGVIYIRNKEHVFRLLEGTSIVSKDGVYISNLLKPYVDSEKTVYIPVKMLEKVFDITYQFSDDDQAVAVFASEQSNLEQEKGENNPYLDFEEAFPKMSVDDIVAYLSFLAPPLEGVHISTRDSQLPAAPRAYRNGTHEGIDWYSGFIGVNVDRSTPVFSMADGIVVRADIDYVELTNEERNEMLEIAKSADHTPQYILDKLRGQTVWVQYPNGVMVRYAHLSRVAPGIEVGKSVKKGEILGYVGNSGTSYGVDGNDLGLHLHSDILIYDHLFWEYLDREQIRDVLEKLFPYSNENDN